MCQIEEKRLLIRCPKAFCQRLSSFGNYPYASSPTEGFLLCTPLPTRNSSSFSYIASKNLALRPPSLPTNFQLPFMGWIWIFSGATHCGLNVALGVFLYLLLIYCNLIKLYLLPFSSYHKRLTFFRVCSSEQHDSLSRQTIAFVT